jgi:hypothetical protein
VLDELQLSVRFHAVVELCGTLREANPRVSTTACGEPSPASSIINSHHADLYFDAVGFRWQRVMTGHAVVVRAGDARSSSPCGVAFFPPFSAPMSLHQLSGDNRVGQDKATSRSNAPPLGLVDNGALLYAELKKPDYGEFARPPRCSPPRRHYAVRPDIPSG